MESKEIKMNLGLVDALIKLREASVIFDEQAAIISEKNEMDYINEKQDFNANMFRCMHAVQIMIGESVKSAVYDLIPDKA